MASVQKGVIFLKIKKQKFSKTETFPETFQMSIKKYFPNHYQHKQGYMFVTVLYCQVQVLERLQNIVFFFLIGLVIT